VELYLHSVILLHGVMLIQALRTVYDRDLPVQRLF
jgi:hypothetical protein